MCSHMTSVSPVVVTSGSASVGDSTSSSAPRETMIALSPSSAGGKGSKGLWVVSCVSAAMGTGGTVSSGVAASSISCIGLM